MNTLRILALSGLVALGATATATGVRAMPVVSLEQSAAGLGPIVAVRHRGRPHRVYRGYPHTRLYVTPGEYPYAYAYPYAYGYYGETRGFEDPGYAYHGNIPGNCAVDLGYGRYESCDK